MKRLLALVLSGSIILTACGSPSSNISSTSEAVETAISASESFDIQESDQKQTDKLDIITQEETSSVRDVSSMQSSTAEETSVMEVSSTEEDVSKYNSLDDPELLDYIEESIYYNLVDDFSSDDYIIEDISTVYYSQEYLEEVAYNSKANIFFGYTLTELDEQFNGTPYVFSLGENGETIVKPFEDYDDTYDKVIKNVAVGTGVILICITVSVVTGGVGVAPVSMVFATAAKTGTNVALSSGFISGVFAGSVKGVQTRDFNEALKAAALAGSEGFKWGAITGAISGGISGAREVNTLVKTKPHPSYLDKAKEAEQRVLSKYPGEEQVSYINGEKVPFNTPGSTRPDIVRTVDNHLEAIEVKYYDLSSKNNVSRLCHELKRQVGERQLNLPSDATQRIVLDVTDRNITKSVAEEALSHVRISLEEIYPNIPVELIGL